MKTKIASLAVAACLAGPFAVAGDIPLQTEDEKISYSGGYQLGGDLQGQRVELNAEVMVQGVVEGATPSIKIRAGVTPPLLLVYVGGVTLTPVVRRIWVRSPAIAIPPAASPGLVAMMFSPILPRRMLLSV